MSSPPPFGGIYAGKRVLVTGATGFKGSWLCQWLTTLGAEVIGLSVDLPSNPCHWEAINLSASVCNHFIDVRDLTAVREIVQDQKPDFLFHLAAQALVRSSYDDPLATLSTNVMGTANLLEVVRGQESIQAAVFITSDKCYENVEQHAGYHELDRLGGKDPYSASKAAAEVVFSTFARSYFGAPNRFIGEESTGANIRTLIATARAGNVIGGGDWAKDRIIPDCVRAWSNHQSPIIRSPDATRPWQHVLEPLSGYLWLGARLWQREIGLHGESFNFGPLPQTNETVLKLIESIQGFWPETEACEIHQPEISRPEAGLLRLDCEKVEMSLGWRATLDFEETAQFTADWYRGFASSPEHARERTQLQIDDYVHRARDRDANWTKTPND